LREGRNSPKHSKIRAKRLRHITLPKFRSRYQAGAWEREKKTRLVCNQVSYPTGLFAAGGIGLLGLSSRNARDVRRRANCAYQIKSILDKPSLSFQYPEEGFLLLLFQRTFRERLRDSVAADGNARNLSLRWKRAGGVAARNFPPGRTDLATVTRGKQLLPYRRVRFR
jgi:hypothetical protein